VHSPASRRAENSFCHASQYMSSWYRVLLLNWRDPWHPNSGGAEHLTLRILERLAAQGWRIEWFSGMYSGAASREERDKILYVREGSGATVHVRAFLRYSKRRDFDVVIDQINTVPFFTPWYAARSIAWFQQLAREVWFYEGGRIGVAGYIAEPFYLRPYRCTPIVTISRSSARSLRQIGLRGRIRIIPMAVDDPADTVVPPKKEPRDLLVIGRLTPSKRVDESIKAAALLRARGWGGQLHIVGSGPLRYRVQLEALVKKLNIGKAVIFRGRIDDSERRCLMRSASVLWMTSVREGWGLVVTEAARHGTPAVVYDVPGLCDSVVHGETGLVVPPAPATLAAATLTLFKHFDRFAGQALIRATPLNWDSTALEFANAVTQDVSPKR